MINYRSKVNSNYEKIKHLGEGQFANVYQAKNLETGMVVAIKKVKLGSRHEARDGVNRTALREIKLLQELRHENIVSLLDVIGHRTSIQLVFDYMETDLENIIKSDSTILMLSHIKNMLLQILVGLEYLHINFVLHRDLKPNNLLINQFGRIKIADFGLARFYGSPNRIYTHQVVTRWYRAPELLYGARAYSTGVDMWAVGCIIAELLLRKPIFPGESDIDQLVKIYQVLGTPTEDDWPEMKTLPDYIAVKNVATPCPLNLIFTAATPDLMELILKCLQFNPLNRWTSTEALSSPYFKTEPFACEDSELPISGKQRKRKFVEGDDGPPSARRKLDFDTGP